jgi:ribosomal protein L37AE/L43A
MKQKQVYCPDCKKNVAATKNTPNHILHLALTIVTCGAWAIVWGFLLTSPGHFMCNTCGHKTNPAKKKAQKFCPHCEKTVMAFYYRPAFTVHLILSLFTLVWIIPTIIIAIRGGKWSCSECHLKFRKSKSKAAQKVFALETA